MKIRNKFVKFLVVFFVFLVVNNNVLSFFEEVSNLKGSARSIATSASLATDDVIAGIITNPASIVSKKNVISLFYSSMFGGLSNSSSLNFVYKFPVNSKIFKKTKLENFGASVFYNSVEFTDSTLLEFNDINQNGIKDADEEILYDKSKLSKGTNTNLALCLATVRSFKNFLVGFGAKYFHSKIVNDTASFITLDTAFKLCLKDNLKISGKINNLFSTSISWTTGSKETPQMSFELGLLYSYKIGSTLLLNTTLDYGTTKNKYVSVGEEIVYNRKYFLRCGICRSSLNEVSSNSISAGFGIILENGISIDYALKILQEAQENMHFVSLSYNFSTK